MDTTNTRTPPGHGVQRHGRCSFVVGLPALLILSALTGTTLAQNEAAGVRAPEGFRVTLFADDELAHDIYSLTIDSFGRVVVSGAGYVRILIDSDDDGVADSTKEFVDGPTTGSQGMYFHGRDLVCSGDDGLQIYRDDNRDDRADGPPEVFLRAKTGSEHHTHSIQRGPDGWWYVIAGNYAGITDAYATIKSSPIRKPRAGTLLRLKPDLFGGEIVADGFRNAYDFAFSESGDVFTFDSDGERDISLPWYRPTRVFHVTPMSDAGWLSRSWKRPDAFFDMPPVLGSFGRGSPTGVVCYRHDQFPEKYRGAVIVCDWTFGRVIALPLQSHGAIWSSEPVELLTGVGQFGFAPTDAEVGPDGSLYVSIGGRGTRGGVYRIRWEGDGKDNTNADAADDLATILSARQPLSSWSRAKWVPLAEAFGREAFQQAALDGDRTESQRIRAIEVLTELYDGPDSTTLAALVNAKSPRVRARAAWALGRMKPEAPDTRLLSRYLDDDDPLVVRFALEALTAVGERTDSDQILPALARQLGSPHRPIRQTAAYALQKLDAKRQTHLRTLIDAQNPAALLAMEFGRVIRTGEFDEQALKLGMEVLSESRDAETRIDAARLMQLALGDVGPVEKRVPVFDGYAPRVDLSEHERSLDPIRIRLGDLYPTGNADVDHEVVRVISMLAPYNATLLDKLLQQITPDSHPVDDIHHLLAASRIEVERTIDQSRMAARALILLEPKTIQRGLNQDSNWEDRVSELYKQLVKVDPVVAEALVDQPEFGFPGHVPYLSELPPQLVPKAIAGFVRQIQNDDEYSWTNDVVFVLGESSDERHRELLRGQSDNFAIRDALVMVLSEEPDPSDRGLLIEGLGSSNADAIAAAASALVRLPLNTDAREFFTLLAAARRLGENKREFEIREKLMRVLQHNTGQQHGFVFGEEGHEPQAEVFDQWSEWLTGKYPKVARTMQGANQTGLARLRELTAAANWESGDADRGEVVFRKRACLQCHGARRALGPDLKGVAGRFSRDDLLTAIFDPNRDVSTRYQTTVIETSDGKVITGLIIYESVDGVLMRNGIGQTFRVEADEIESQRKLPVSLMPAGLLKDCTADELADLYAYLKTLGKK